MEISSRLNKCTGHLVYGFSLSQMNLSKLRVHSARWAPGWQYYNDDANNQHDHIIKIKVIQSHLLDKLIGEDLLINCVKEFAFKDYLRQQEESNV